MSAVNLKLDAKGRCCGRKPLVYKRDGYLFCDRCDAQFSLDGVQQANWAWLKVTGGFWPRPQANPQHLKKAHDKARAARDDQAMGT